MNDDRVGPVGMGPANPCTAVVRSPFRHAHDVEARGAFDEGRLKPRVVVDEPPDEPADIAVAEARRRRGIREDRHRTVPHGPRDPVLLDSRVVRTLDQVLSP